jgi:hypothetical protein
MMPPLPPDISYLIIMMRKLRKVQKEYYKPKGCRTPYHEEEVKILERQVDILLEKQQDTEQPTLFEHIDQTQVDGSGRLADANLPEDEPCEGGYD